MGFNTTVLILNDQLDQIRSDPKQFVETLFRAIQGADVYVPGQTTVMESQHADVFRLYSTQGNMILELSKCNRDTMALAQRSPETRMHVIGMIGAAQRELRLLLEAIGDLDD